CARRPAGIYGFDSW
nr:immunoglobulin heavy chain junction region [Macaca mulatta]